MFLVGMFDFWRVDCVVVWTEYGKEKGEHGRYAEGRSEGHPEGIELDLHIGQLATWRSDGRQKTNGFFKWVLNETQELVGWR